MRIYTVCLATAMIIWAITTFRKFKIRTTFNTFYDNLKWDATISTADSLKGYALEYRPQITVLLFCINGLSIRYCAGTCTKTNM